jgi:hypothetical protein
LQRTGAPVLLDLLQGGFELFETCPHGGQQFEALVRDFHAPAVAPKKRDLNVPFQGLDLLTDGGGRDIERIGGGGEAQVSGHGLEYPQGSQRQSVIGGRHFKSSLTACQTLHLLRIGARSNVFDVGSTNTSEHIMNEINLAARLAQGLLAITVVFAIGLAFQLALQHEARPVYVAAQGIYGLPQTTASRFS